MGYDSATWDPILNDIATKYGINPKLLTSIARAEGVASGDFNPLGISPGGGGPTHYADVSEGRAGMEAYVSNHLPHFLEATRTGDIEKFARWYSPPDASNDPYHTNWQEASNIRGYMGGDRNVIGWKPGDVDFTQNSTSLLSRFREDNPEFRMYSNDSVLKEMQDGLAPGMDPQQFQTAATSPGGIADINAYKQSPLYQLRQAFGEDGKDLTDAELLHKTYDYGVGNKTIDAKKESFEEFQERFAPVQSWQAQTGRFVKSADQLLSETIRQVAPQTEELGLQLYGGIHQMQATAGVGDINSVLGLLYPGQDTSARLREYAQLSVPDAEAKLRADMDAAGPDFQNRLIAQGLSPDRLFDRMDAGLAELKSKAANEAMVDWANKMVIKTDKENPGNLPENQEKIAKLIAQTPGQVLMSLVPGLREAGNYTQLYKQNYDTIKRDHPDWDENTIDARAHRAADEQFPAQEFLSLIMAKGTPQIRAGLSGMILSKAASLTAATQVGGLTMSANQIITNIEDDKPPLQGVSEAYQSGVIMGGVGGVIGEVARAGSNLSVSGLKRSFLASPQIRKAMGVSEGIVTQGADGTMRMVNGNGDSPVEKKVELNALDMSLNGIKAAVAETKEPESPVVEAFRKAEEARESGDTGEAQKYVDQALSLATPTQRDIINKHVAAQLRAVTDTPPPTIAKPKAKEETTAVPIEWKTLPRYQHKASLPEGAETRVNTVTGETEYRVVPQKKEVSEKPVIDYFGTAKAPKPEEKIKPPSLEQKDHGFPSGHIQTRPDGQADLFLENGVKLTFPDVGDAVEARGTIRKSRTHKWEARSSGGETISQAELNNGTEVETVVPPKTEEKPPDEVATEPVITYQPELDTQGKPTGRQIAFRDGKRIGVVNPKAPGQTVEPVTPARATPLEGQLQRSIEHQAALKKVQGVRGWNIGDTVNVGFMRGLKVLRRIPTPGDYAADQWLLQSAKGDHYLFTPHKGLQKLEEGEEGLGAFYNPFAAMRSAKRWAGQFPPWQRLERGIRKTLAPQRLSEEAADVAAISIPLQTGAKTNLINQIYQLALHNNLNGVFDRATESERREAFFNGKTDGQLRRWVIDWANNGTTNNPIADKLLAFSDEVTKVYSDMATKSKVTNSFLANLFTHAFKDREAAFAWYNEQIETTNRVPTFQEAIRAGLELRTYNPERLMLAHAATVMEGLKEIDMMEQMVESGYAALDPGWVKTQAERQGKKISVPRQAPYGWTGKYDAADGKRYIMSPEAAAVVKNLFGPNRLYEAIDMLPGHFFNALKGTLGAKLSWSQFHQTHVGVGIVPADVMTEYMQRVAKGLGKPGETLKAIGGAAEGYLSIPVSAARMVSSLIPRKTGVAAKYLDPFFEGMIPTARKFHALVDVMQGKGDYDKLTLVDKRNYDDLLAMGIVARPSHERYLQWTGWLAKQSKAGKLAATPVQWVYNLLTNPGFGHWYFGRVLPSLKIAAALRKRDTVLRYYDREGINLRDPSNAQTLRGEFAKINRDVEGRFGEMLYDNLLWDKTAKGIGTQTQLSLGWGLGFWRMYGDAVQDLSDNALNLDRIANHTYKNPEVVTNRMLFALNYWGATMAAGIATSVVLGGVAPNAIRFIDGIFPQIGTDKNGQPIRVRPPFWSSELVSMFENASRESGGNLFSASFGAGLIGEAGQYTFNRLSPALHTFYQMAINKDWRGRLIGDPTDPFWTQLGDQIMYGVKDLFSPIGVETAMSGRARETRAKIAALLGFGPAPAWVNRSPFENLVIYKAEQQHPFGTIGHREADYFDLRAQYMVALQSKDPQLIDEALKNWQAIRDGITPGEIKNARDEVLKTGHGKINTGLNEWKKLDEDTQFHLLEVAPKELFLDYFNHALKQTRQRWISVHGPLTPDQLAQTQEAQ